MQLHPHTDTHTHTHIHTQTHMYTHIHWEKLSIKNYYYIVTSEPTCNIKIITRFCSKNCYVNSKNFYVRRKNYENAGHGTSTFYHLLEAWAMPDGQTVSTTLFGKAKRCSTACRQKRQKGLCRNFVRRDHKNNLDRSPRQSLRLRASGTTLDTDLQGDDQGCGSRIWLKLQEVLLYDK